MNDSELLEQFIHALRQNPHAVPPAGLDPELVEVARALVQQVSSPTSDARRRIWERALIESRTLSNGYNKELNPMTVITARPLAQERTGSRYPLTLVAAAIAALLCVTAFLLIPNRAPNLPSLGITQQQDNTATPPPTLVPTSTPSPADLPTTVPTASPFPMTSTTNLRGSYVYVPVIPIAEALELAGTDENRIQSIELMYRITLSDGSVAYIHAQPIPEGQTGVSLVMTVFPGTQIIYSSEADYGDTTYEVLVLNNGVNVFWNASDAQMIFFTFGSGDLVPFVEPTIVPPSADGNPASSPVPLPVEPTVVRPSTVITSTPIAMPFEPTIVPPPVESSPTAIP